MTPAEYREKWGLPRDYPMVAPNYAAQRSELAKKSGLGRKAAAPILPAKAKRKALAKAK
jgi:predicted transcriptional regulator